ncbi:MAG: hypothetical protein JWP78_1717 [Mucilaginibacter sp.]|nr:hypothetical protein [Mucilaginibacter sp.]
MPIKKVLFYFLLIIPALLSSCSRKKVIEGSISYSIEYQLPDSLHKYLLYLPKSAKVYFKGDSAVSIQQMNDEATTVITYKPTDFMRVLLASNAKKYVIDYNKADQAKESPARLGYSYIAATETRTIAGYKALKYTLTDKVTGETAEAWFTKEVTAIPNSLTMPFDTTKGVPLAFTVNHNGMIIKTTVKDIRFEPIPAGLFSTPAGYEPLTPKQLRDMPVEN